MDHGLVASCKCPGNVYICIGTTQTNKRLLVYQLPNGKVIQITIEQYLDLTDEDIQYLMSINYGEYATSPWLGSSISKKSKKKEPLEEVDKSLDYTPEDEDRSHGDNVAPEEIPLDECHDIPDESTLD